jgi:hypothetical protein
MADKDKVVGKALYLEFRSTGQTYQILLTPDGISSNGRAVPATIYRRQISKLKPRRAWKTYSLPTLPVNSFGTYDQAASKDEALNIAEVRMNYMATTFTQLNSYHYKLHKQPIVIEVAQEDLESIRLSKTPYKILGRITRVRRTLGFGEFITD